MNSRFINEVSFRNLEEIESEYYYISVEDTVSYSA